MTVLVADVGGTNTRVALASAGQLVHLARFANDAYGSFAEVLTAYARGRDLPGLRGVCVAVAGPVANGRAELTNRNWHFDTAELAAPLPGQGDVAARLINDLVALGHALPGLTAAQLDVIRAGAVQPSNDQALVAGLGTGFNTCLLKGGAVVEAELGHASLPLAIAEELRAQLGDAAGGFRTNECLFSGRGLSRLHAILSGQDRRGQDILADYAIGEDPQAAATVTLTARLLGLFARELVFQYLPFRGIHFAGGAARGILGSAARAEFLSAFEADGRFADHLDRVPVRLIADDAAALSGAARLMEECA
ncbi:glucokinase [Ruegeria pomeroyi]|uniref:Glucokinase, putative n=2 Tax=Ruegeria pomeroyi TaxID=89184 RepID=Q5LV38_RUEPO|nr:glucokinase [Ruegeria pomeroyi]AAV94169.1 glucokinase, putative [Ruegeria pomeroyi DSS-3]NVK95758.1 glucokinase [Ruegeria pomeroyi]NVL01159.1 glucokinase [Ruegeria pomeroyi]QWV11034.1 glucokinase [Ruegeria pomeroyi]